MSYLTSFPGEANLMDVLMADGARAAPLLGYTRHVMRGPSAFTPAEREMIFAFVSGLNACSYCFGQHSHAARLLGIDEGLIDALVHDVQTAPVDDRFKPVLAYVAKLTRAPSTVVASDVEGMAAAGWDDRAVLDANAVCGLANLMNRVVDGTGVEMDQTGLQRVGVMIAENGYAPPGGPTKPDA
jgi:uncharacterized peroxidase-related enzyme